MALKVLLTAVLLVGPHLMLAHLNMVVQLLLTHMVDHHIPFLVLHQILLSHLLATLPIILSGKYHHLTHTIN